MPHTDSILRYPGGKSQLKKFIQELITLNRLENATYIEPYAGGAGLALSLLFKGDVKKVIINDYDLAIWSVWNTVLTNPEELKKRIIEEEISIENWHFHRVNYQKIKSMETALSEADQLDLAFSTLFLNRTNISGIIKGGVIGGVNQTGNYKLDCRYNKKTLIKKIDLISSYSSSIELHNLDAIEFVNKVVKNQNPDKTLVFFDPPYYKKGPDLYSNFYSHDDHLKIAEIIQKADLQCKWITTYDECSEIKEMYSSSRGYLYTLKYSLADKRSANELMFISNNLMFKNNFMHIQDLEAI
ncbi:DNA adenine methylase [Exiguobacterium sp. AT1b]|uniref:DNA adenine methylase n=1 Tax=Exiguobacterium sp. (strain ATCC BAA-1283 / AT1b) TaxID=360911 RepID=UPI00093DFA93|nr:DNA adenine methylase [Exiguobacterium sp. AT1b]